MFNTVSTAVVCNAPHIEVCCINYGIYTIVSFLGKVIPGAEDGSIKAKTA